MSYNEIAEVVAKFPHYTFPIQADDEDGNKIVITEGESEVYEDMVKKTVHYYKVYTYLKDSRIRTNIYYANGMNYEAFESELDEE